MQNLPKSILREKQEQRQKIDQNTKLIDFDALRISIASPDKILNWSYGEVFKPETINYRTQKPERDGLFDERIFGPTKDWECYCGKYKRIRYKGVVCDKCGVEVTRSSVRRERMGHIDLAVPVVHIWYIRGIPSILSMVLDISISDLEKVIYFAGFIIKNVNQEIKNTTLEQLEHEYHDLKTKKDKISSEQWLEIETNYKNTKTEIDALRPKRVLSENEYYEISLKYGQIVQVGIGAEAIFDLLKQINFDEVITELSQAVEETQGPNKRKFIKRLGILTGMKNSNIHPSYLVITRLPVIPPDLRPMVQLDGGRFATSDLNDLYRRVLNRNNRLKRLLNTGAPEVICRNEKRMLQEAVDALIDNSARRGRAAATTGSARKLRSLSDMLRGKQGRFRQNLLGKRVDYSGRSVIVVGPELKLHQCGLPKMMALELFKPFVIAKLIERGFVHNVKNASRLIERQTSEVWDILEEITTESKVMLNRAPTLHRLGIQSFQPVLIEGKAIQIHPLVCWAFNADFDGDQMAVHVPLSKESKKEAEELLLSTHNLLKPSSGEPVVSPRLDIVFGIYFLTSIEEGSSEATKFYTDEHEAITAYQTSQCKLREPIKVRTNECIIETTIGRLLFNEIVPEKLGRINETLSSKILKKLVIRCFNELGQDTTADFVDSIKTLGFRYAEISGMTLSISDIVVPVEKNEIIEGSNKKVDEILKKYYRGLITEEEKSEKVFEIWTEAKEELQKHMMKGYTKDNPVNIMVDSGARGSTAQLIQMGGMKGLVVNPAGEFIELPIRSNYKEGLSVYEYFVSTHGSRKGRSDTALKTSGSGYLTRRLVDVAQAMVIKSSDCKTKLGIPINRNDTTEINENYSDRIVHRFIVQDIVDPKSKKIILKSGKEITPELAIEIENNEQIEEILVRTPIHCLVKNGICQKCYGRDLATLQEVKEGEAVGIMAAQAIGEPGTQLTMRTFHLGGVSGADITQGLPRVEELFEARTPHLSAVLSEIDGTVKIIKSKEKRTIQVFSDQKQEEEINLEELYEPTIKNGEIVKIKQAIAVAENKKAIRAPITGKVVIKGKSIKIIAQENTIVEYEIIPEINILVKDGQKITKGTQLTEGSLNLDQVVRLLGSAKAQTYIIPRVKEIYLSQGQAINDKHIEVIIRQMFSKVKIISSQYSEYLEGDISDKREVEEFNKGLNKGQSPVDYEEIIMGISEVALKTESFLSAASFQETTSVLIENAIKGSIDKLEGLKENVIIGRLIPAGTGLDYSHTLEKSKER